MEAESIRRNATSRPVGQITSDLQNKCQALDAKIFRLILPQIRNRNVSPHPRGGALAIATNVGMRGGGRGGVRLVEPDETLSAYGEVVWFWRCHAGAKSCVKSRKVTVTQLLTGEITI
jgi:hypothetical protein